MAVAGSLTYSTKLDDSGFNKGISALGKATGAVFKGISAAVGVAATAISGLVTASVAAYSQYEQLVGGVEKLFQESGTKVQEYAKVAFKTAGISANQYMETVTGISANLIKSLGGDTEKAADAANTAIIDMADNANTFGTSMEDVQNVYSSLAKGMFVTLDNLKLGYAGTKAGAEQMIADANRIKEANGEMANLSVDSYADLVEAIHIAQTQLNISGYSVEELNKKLKEMSLTDEEIAKVAKSMGISYEEAMSKMRSGTLNVKDAQVLLGTTAREASTTIQGSLNQAKAAWSNLVTGLSDKNADISELVGNLVDSVAIFGMNIIPVIEEALLGVGTLIEELLPVVLDRIPALIEEFLPKLLESAVRMVETIMNGLNQNLHLIVQGALNILTTLINTFLTMLPQILQMGITIILELAKGITEQLPTLIPLVIETVKLIGQTIVDNLPTIIQAGVEIISALIEGLADAIPELLPIMVDAVVLIVEALIDNLDLLIDAGIDLILALADGLIEAIPRLIDKVPIIIDKWINAVVANGPKIAQAGVILLGKLAEGIVKAIPSLVMAALNIMGRFIEGILQSIGAVLDAGGRIVGSIVEAIAAGLYKVVEIGGQIIQGIWQGIQNGWNWLWDKVTGFFQGLLDGICDFLGIHSPSKVFSDEVGKWIPRGVAVGIDANTDSAIDSIDKMNDEIIDKMSEASAFEVGKMAYSGTGGTVNEILSGNSVIRVENYNTLELDGEKVYENQKTIESNKNLQYAFGGAK